MEKHFKIPYLTPWVAQLIYETSSARKMEMGSRLAGRVDVNCHSRMILGSVGMSPHFLHFVIDGRSGPRDPPIQ